MFYTTSKIEKEKQKAAKKLFKEANKRLESEMKRKNLEEITLAQGMLHGVKMLRTEEDKASTEALALAKKIQTKSTKISDYFKRK